MSIFFFGTSLALKKEATSLRLLLHKLLKNREKYGSNNGQRWDSKTKKWVGSAINIARDWNIQSEITLADLAVASENKQFLAHRYVQSFYEQRWEKVAHRWYCHLLCFVVYVGLLISFIVDLANAGIDDNANAEMVNAGRFTRKSSLWVEPTFWLMMVSYLVDETMQLLELQTLHRYLNFWASGNALDASTLVLQFIAFCVRMLLHTLDRWSEKDGWNNLLLLVFASVSVFTFFFTCGIIFLTMPSAAGKG
jgi:hypothetical protein